MPDEITLHVELLGQPVIDRKLARIKDGISDFSPLWGKVRDWFYQAEADQFASQGRGMWKPLAASTRKDRARHGFIADGPILERTGLMLASFLGGPGSVDVATPLTLQIGSEWKTKDGRWTLPILHARGTHTMPARPPIGFESKQETPRLWPGDASRLRAVFSQYIHSLVTKPA